MNPAHAGAELGMEWVPEARRMGSLTPVVRRLARSTARTCPLTLDAGPAWGYLVLDWWKVVCEKAKKPLISQITYYRIG